MAIMTSRQAAEFDFALERNGWTAEDVKKASGGDLLAKLLLVVRDRAEVVVKSILTLMRTVRIAAQPALTASEEYFKEAGVVWTGSNFQAQFLGLEVPATEEAELDVRKLEEDSFNEPILEVLGDKAEISPSQLRAFLAANRESPEWFVFYLHGKDGNLWAVRALWGGAEGGWRVGADSVDGPRRRDVGDRVVSR